MTAILEKLVVTGFGKSNAVIDFRPLGNLIRGPSDTGKSHIRDCLWYLLGGDKAPKRIPPNYGYDTLLLQISTSSGDRYTIKRALDGGATAVYATSIDAIGTSEPTTDDIGTLLIGIAGASGISILRSMSKRGPLTAGDLRHWFLVSQPAMISEGSTMGTPTEIPQRRAAFCVYLTGKDDSAVVLAPTNEEKIQIKTKIAGIQNDLKRINSELPEQSSHGEAKSALERVDDTFSLLSSQQTARSKQLKSIREKINNLAGEATRINSSLTYSSTMIARFELLAEKYKSDYSRLIAISDGIAIIEALDDQPCPLCSTPSLMQHQDSLTSNNFMSRQRAAMKAEAEKIRALEGGLRWTLDREIQQREILVEQSDSLKAQLEQVEKNERQALIASNDEFSVDPKLLAIRRSELYSTIKLHEEQERLTAELERLSNLVPSKAAPLSRQTQIDGAKVGQIALRLLRAWGLTDIDDVELDAVECDIKINGRARLSYGAGMRSVFLTAMTVALLEYSMARNNPHLGLIVLDSPMKSYSDPSNRSDISVSPVTVKDSFYKWLASWEGPGQIIVLENETIEEETAALLQPIQFTKSLEHGRYGFYPMVHPGEESAS